MRQSLCIVYLRDPEMTLVTLLTFHESELVPCPPAGAAGSLGTVQGHVDARDPLADEKIETQRGRRGEDLPRHI